MHQTQLINGDMLIGDILNSYPEAAQIMEDFGLHCTGCSVNAFEPLGAGAKGHGMPDERVEELISKLNELAMGKKNIADPDGIYMTPRAAFKVAEFAKAEDKEGYSLRITAHPDEKGGEPGYAMDFIDKEEKEDKVFDFESTKVLLNPASFELLKGSDIDYLQTKMGEGFKITNPNFGKGGCCGGSGGGCGEGGCGSGSCGCKS
ncbi:MAG: iron-sulfur cluster assembly protein [Oceanicoccus sp.]|jgi:iron-sulfur cluster assembly protein